MDNIESEKLHRRNDNPRFRGGETVRPNFDLRQLADKLWKVDRQNQKALLRGAHERLWHATAAQMRLMLKRIGAPESCLELCDMVIAECEACMAFQRPPRRPTVKVREFRRACAVGSFLPLGFDLSADDRRCDPLEARKRHRGQNRPFYPAMHVGVLVPLFWATTCAGEQSGRRSHI